MDRWIWCFELLMNEGTSRLASTSLGMKARRSHSKGQNGKVREEDEGEQSLKFRLYKSLNAEIWK